MKPINIRIQNSSVKEGIVDDLVICWEYGDADVGKRQKACRILLKEAEIGKEQSRHSQDKVGSQVTADTGFLPTDKQNNHSFGKQDWKKRLETHTKYIVEVIVWDGEKEEKGVSQVYVSGVCREEDWNGVWVGCGKGDPFYCVKRVSLPEEISEAYLSVAATGQYECRINGCLPDDSLLNGSWTDFHKRIHYRTFPVGNLLRTGEQCISIEVGNGWYLGYAKDDRHFYTLDKGYEPFGKVLGVRAVLSLYRKDGSVLRIGTDEGWEIEQSPITYTNIYGSEDFDGFLDRKPWEKKEKSVLHACGMKNEAPSGMLLPSLYPPVKCIRTYEGEMIWTDGEEEWIYDMGQNMAAQFEIAVRGSQGTIIRVSCTEVWEQGQAFQPKTNSWCEYRLYGEEERLQVFCQRFTYAAGRYVKVSCRERKKQKLEIVSVKGHFLSSSAEKTGDFVCSDFRYMQVYDLIEKAVDSNLNHVHTDCPTIEKLGWQEPNHLMAPSVMYMKRVNTLWEKIEEDQVDSQYGEMEEDDDEGMFPHHYGPGLLPSIAPRYARFLYDGGDGSFWDIIPWGSSLVMGLEERFRFYGETGKLSVYYPVISRYVDYEYDKYLRYAEIFGGEKGEHFLKHGLGDWGTWKKKDNSRQNVETAYLYQDLMLTAKLAQKLGKDKEKQEYTDRAEALKKEYNDRLLVQNVDTGLWYYKTYGKTQECCDSNDVIQTNQALPLYFHMVPEDKISSVTESFLWSVREHRFEAGEIGLPYIFRILGELGRADLVQDMIFQKEHPSYYRFVEHGETTLPEFWSDAARSRNHDMMGSIMEWFYRYMAGISSEDGYSTIQIKPQLPEGVTFLRCTFYAITGKISIVVYRNQRNEISMECRIPVNTAGTARLGEREYYLEGGICYRLG